MGQAALSLLTDDNTARKNNFIFRCYLFSILFCFILLYLFHSVFVILGGGSAGPHPAWPCAWRAGLGGGDHGPEPV